MESQNTVLWDEWKVVRRIGQGSFGAVYEIERDLLGKKEKAALKHIRIPQNPSDVDELYSEGYDDDSITETFKTHLQSIMSEYSLMRKLNGAANVVGCDDVKYIQRNDGIGWDIYIRMELLTPLIKALPDHIPVEMVEKLARDICQALVLCKHFDIIHRDIKPQNIFISPLGDFKLGDFGIAKTVEKTMGGTKTGTYKYMAPEVYHNQPYGQQADIYSLGLVLYWMLNKKRMPFMPLPPEKVTAEIDDQARKRRLSGEPLPPPADGSEALKNIVLRACAYHPMDRFPSAEEMLKALNTPDFQGLRDPQNEDAAARIYDDQMYDTPDDKTVGPFRRKTEERRPAATVAPLLRTESDSEETVGGFRAIPRKPGKQTVENWTQIAQDYQRDPPKQQKATPIPPAAPQQQAARKENKNRVWIVAAVIVLFAGAAVAIWFYLHSGNQDDVSVYYGVERTRETTESTTQESAAEYVNDVWLTDLIPVKKDPAVYVLDQKIGMTNTEADYHCIFSQREYSEIVYRLNGDYDMLTALWAIGETNGEDASLNNFELYADERLIYTSDTIFEGSSPVNVVASVQNCNYLRILFKEGTGSGKLGNIRLSNTQPRIPNAVAAEETLGVWLTDLDVLNEEGMFICSDEVNTSNIGTSYAHYIYNKTQGFVEYALQGKYNHLDGVWSICHENKENGTPSAFCIYADDILVYTSPEIQAGDLPVSVSVDFPYCSVLKIDFTVGTGAGEFGNIRLTDKKQPQL